MIFVTVGTNEAPFDRLLHAVDRLGGEEELIVQVGSSSVRPTTATCIEYMPFDDLLEHVRRARVVVTHGGIGSIMSALAEGKRPVVVCRLARHGEAVDDHQLPIARQLHEIGLVRLVEDVSELAAEIATAGAVDVEIAPDRRLVEELRAFIDEHADHPSPTTYSR